MVADTCRCIKIAWLSSTSASKSRTAVSNGLLWRAASKTKERRLRISAGGVSRYPLYYRKQLLEPVAYTLHERDIKDERKTSIGSALSRILVASHDAAT